MDTKEPVLGVHITEVSVSWGQRIQMNSGTLSIHQKFSASFSVMSGKKIQPRGVYRNVKNAERDIITQNMSHNTVQISLMGPFCQDMSKLAVVVIRVISSQSKVCFLLQDFGSP